MFAAVSEALRATGQPPPDRVDQAQLLFKLHPVLDLDYLARRIREESSDDYGIGDL